MSILSAVNTAHSCASQPPSPTRTPARSNALKQASGLREQPNSPTRGRPPHPPRPFSPCQSPGAKGGQAIIRVLFWRILVLHWQKIGDCPQVFASRMDFNSQFSILNSVSRFEFFQPIAVLAAARYCGAATTYSLSSPKISKASSRIVRSSGKIGHLRMPRP